MRLNQTFSFMIFLIFTLQAFSQENGEYRWVSYNLPVGAVEGYDQLSDKCVSSTKYSIYKGTIFKIVRMHKVDGYAEIEIDRAWQKNTQHQAPLDTILCMSLNFINNYTIKYQYLDIGPLALPYKLRFDATEGIQLAPGGTAGVFIGRRIQREKFRYSIGGALTLGTTAIGSLNSEATTSKFTLSISGGSVFYLTSTVQAGIFIGWDFFEGFTEVPFHNGLPYLSISLGYSFIGNAEQNARRAQELKIVQQQLAN